MSLTAIEVTGAELAASGPQTPAQQFLDAYTKYVDTTNFSEDSLLKFYAPNIIFHDQKNSVYRGLKEVLDWLEAIFKPFSKVHNEVIYAREFRRSDGTVTVDVQGMRHLWVKGQDFDPNIPTVSIPVVVMFTTGPSETAHGYLGMQMKEAWVYWDTTLLMPFIKK
ncbi:hypothetical protein B7463_g8703, partial [Scytalidium lignicola]